MLSQEGRDLISGMFGQRGKLYGPGVPPLKDAVTSYPSFTGSNKAQFGSVKLIVFRPVLASVEALVSKLCRCSTPVHIACLHYSHIANRIFSFGFDSWTYAPSRTVSCPLRCIIVRRLSCIPRIVSSIRLKRK